MPLLNWFTNEVFGGTPNAFNQVIVHVDENENNSGLLCYPNPFSESLNILTSTEHGELKYIDIYDSFGRHVETINGFYMTGGGHYYYEWQPGAQVSTGVYLVRATYSNEIVSQQVQFQGLSK